MSTLEHDLIHMRYLLEYAPYSGQTGCSTFFCVGTNSADLGFVYCTCKRLMQWKRVMFVPALFANQYLCQGGVLEFDVVWHDVLSARIDLVVSLLEPTPPNGGLMYTPLCPPKNRALPDPLKGVNGAIGSLTADCPGLAWHVFRGF